MAIENLGDLTIYERTTQEQLIERAKNADILITNKLLVTEETLKQLPRLKLIHQLATGTDNIDKEAAEAQEVKVMNAVGYSTNSVSQHVLALMLALHNHVALHNEEVHAGGWTRSGDWCHTIKSPHELAGKKLGIVGFGKIGQAVADLGLAFGMEVLVTSNHATSDQYPKIQLVSLEELAQQSDFISLHAPLTSNNKGMIDQSFFSFTKPTAFIINTARGGLIVEHDLSIALKTGKLAGAGLDVLCDEPPKADNPLLGLENCIITPHIAWTSFEARKRLIEIVAKNISAFINAQ